MGTTCSLVVKQTVQDFSRAQTTAAGAVFLLIHMHAACSGCGQLSASMLARKPCSCEASGW